MIEFTLNGFLVCFFAQFCNSAPHGLGVFVQQHGLLFARLEFSRLKEMGSSRFGVNGNDAAVGQPDHEIRPTAVSEGRLLIKIDVFAHPGHFEQPSKFDFTPVATCLA